MSKTRVTITTPVPAGTEVKLARETARLAACDALGIHIVEEACITAPHVVWENDQAAPIPGSVDRVLTTVWDILPQ